MRCVVIIGRLRSGGAALASALVPLGFIPGVALTAPAPPDYRLDWDDYRLSKALIQRSAKQPQRIKNAVQAVVRQAKLVESSGVLFKNAYLALHWEFFLNTLVEMNLSPFVVRTIRNESNRMDSLRRTYMLSTYGEELERAVSHHESTIRADYNLHYSGLVNDTENCLDGFFQVARINTDLVPFAASHVQKKERELCPGEQ